MSSVLNLSGQDLIPTKVASNTIHELTGKITNNISVGWGDFVDRPGRSKLLSQGTASCAQQRKAQTKMEL